MAQSNDKFWSVMKSFEADLQSLWGCGLSNLQRDFASGISAILYSLRSIQRYYEHKEKTK